MYDLYAWGGELVRCIKWFKMQGSNCIKCGKLASFPAFQTTEADLGINTIVKVLVLSGKYRYFNLGIDTTI